jgi:hypothetical protein
VDEAVGPDRVRADRAGARQRIRLRRLDPVEDGARGIEPAHRGSCRRFAYGRSLLSPARGRCYGFHTIAACRRFTAHA